MKREMKRKKIKKEIKRKKGFFESFKFEIVSLVLGYGIFVGYIYNYFQFNIGLDFNIFDYVNANDMIFSWITDPYLITFLLILIFVLIIKFIPNQNVLVVISLISIALILIILLPNNEHQLSEVIFILILIIVSICFYIYLFLKNYKVNNDDVNSIKEIINMMNCYRLLFKFDKEIKNCKETFDLKALVDNYNKSIKELKIDNIEIEEYVINLSNEIKTNSEINPLVYWKVYASVCSKILYNLDCLLKMDASIKNKISNIYTKVESYLRNDIANKKITETIIVLVIFSIAPSVFGFIEGEKIKRSCVNVANIKLISYIESNKQMDQLYKIYKTTSNYTIVKKINNLESFIVFNNSDISSIEFINTSQCNDKQIESEFKNKEFNLNYNQNTNESINNIVVTSLNNYLSSDDFGMKIGSIIIPQIDSLFDTKFDFTANFDKLLEYNKSINGIYFKYKDKLIENEKIYFDEISFNIDNNAEPLLEKLLKDIQNGNKYIINLTGNADLKGISSGNKTIKDNYTLSLARANSVKNHILKVLTGRNIDIQNIEFNIYGNSNQKVKSNSEKDEKFVEIDILEFIPVSIDKR
jgi:outer membrane protein OmpA-like peptidoglycan-associated protein